MKPRRPAAAGGPLLIALQAWQAGRLDVALKAALQVVQQQPTHHDALVLAGRICLQQQRLQEAISLLGRAQALKPADQSTACLLAQCWQVAGRPLVAAQVLDALCDTAGMPCDAWLAAAQAWLTAERTGLALQRLTQALSAFPDEPEVLWWLALACRADGQYQQAIATLGRLLALQPARVDARIELAELTAATGDPAAAAANLDQLALGAELPAEPRLRMTQAWLRLGLPERGRALLAPLLALTPPDQRVLLLYGECAIAAGDTSALLALQRPPVSLAERDPWLLVCLAHAAVAAKDMASGARWAALARKDGVSDYQTLAVQIECLDADAPGRQAERLRVRNECNSLLRAKLAPFMALSVATDQPRLKLGLVTSRPDSGPTGHWEGAMLDALAAGFDTYCYFGLAQESGREQRLRSQVAHWRNVAGMADGALAERIRADGIDILIDCDGHHARSRLPVFSIKPAPMQLTLAGAAGTGIQCIDYRLRLPDAVADVALPCVEPLLEVQSVQQLLPALRSAWQQVCQRQQTALAREPAFDEALASNNWAAAEREYCLRGDRLGLNDSRRFIRAARLLAIRDYCSANGLPYRVMTPGHEQSVGLPAYFGAPAPEPAVMAIPEAYLAEVHDAVVFADSAAVLLPDHQAVLDMAMNGGASRFEFRSSTVMYVDAQRLFVSAPIAGEIERFDRAVFLGGPGAFNYYHWLIEIMSRLAWLDETPEYDDWPLLVDQAGLQIPQHAQILDLVNRSGRQVIALSAHRPYRVDRLCVPAHLAWLPFNYRAGQTMQVSDQFLSDKAIQFLRQRLVPPQPDKASPRKRLFIARRGTAGYRHLRNEAELEALFVEFGFEPIRPERLSIQQQIECFSQAQVIAGPTGAGMTNILFAPDDARIICFMPKYLQDFASFSGLAAIRKLPMLFLDGTPVEGSHRIYFQSDFTVDLQQARSLLMSFCPLDHP